MSKREEVVKVEEAKKKAEAAEAGKYTPKSDEEARQMLKALNKWFEDKKKVDEKPKEEPKPEPKPKEEPKPDPKPKEEPKPDTKPKSDPKPKAKEDVIPANDSGLIDGPRKLYKYRSLITGKRVYVADPFVADRFSGGEWTPVWVFMKDGKVHHELNEEETLKFCQQ